MILMIIKRRRIWMCIYQWQYSKCDVNSCDRLAKITLKVFSISTLPYRLLGFLWQPGCPLLSHGVIKPAGRPVPMYKRRRETIHRSALVIPNRWVNSYIRPQVFLYESSDVDELVQLLCPGLRPDVVCWNVSCPVNPIPRARFGYVLEKVLHGAQRQGHICHTCPSIRLQCASNWPFQSHFGQHKWQLTVHKTAFCILHIPVDIREERIRLCGEPGLGGVGGLTGGLGTCGRDTFQGA